MNSVYVKKSEASLVDDTYQVLIVGDRAKELIAEHDLKQGLELNCVLQDAGSGNLIIKKINDSQIEAEIKQIKAPQARLPLRLAVAFSRPQTIKKILQLAAAFGVAELNFVKTDKVVASYLQSKSLKPLEIEHNFILGCQQAREASFPEYRNFYSLQAFIESCNPSQRLLFGDLAETASEILPVAATTLLLGPESGFSPDEKDLLFKHGFKAFSLGARMLRVEVAASALIGRLL